MQTIYLFKVSIEPVAFIEAVSAYLLPFTVLSVCIESVAGFGFGVGQNGDEDDSDLSGLKITVKLLEYTGEYTAVLLQLQCPSGLIEFLVTQFESAFHHNFLSELTS